MSVINLKDNLFLSVTSVPQKAKRLITASSLQFVSESESKWYVHAQDDKAFRNYKNNNWLTTAKDSLRSALQELIGKGQDVDKTKFNIYSIG